MRVSQWVPTSHTNPQWWDLPVYCPVDLVKWIFWIHWTEKVVKRTTVHCPDERLGKSMTVRRHAHWGKIFIIFKKSEYHEWIIIFIFTDSVVDWEWYGDYTVAWILNSERIFFWIPIGFKIIATMMNHWVLHYTLWTDL